MVLGGTGSSVTIGDIAASTAAQTGAVSLVTVDGSGTIGRDSTSIGNINAGLTAVNAGLAAVQAVNTTQTGQINSLFSLTDLNRRDIQKANEGVAMALALDSPSLPSGTNFGVSGGIGYYNHRTAGTIAASARIGPNASLSAGVGFGFDSGEVGARGGVQFAW